MTYYSHYSKWPESEWYWPNFSPKELASRREGELKLDLPSLDKLQALRDLLGVPMYVNSAYRSPEHNAAIGGASNSYHMKGKAFDISVANHNPHVFESAAREVGFTGFGFYPQSNFMHIDTGPEREWGRRFK